VKKTEELTSANAAPNNQPKQLLELARLEIRRRELLQDLAHVKCEMYRLNREVWFLGIEIPWLAREYDFASNFRN
jgi:hypothetical protein